MDESTNPEPVAVVLAAEAPTAPAWLEQAHRLLDPADQAWMLERPIWLSVDMMLDQAVERHIETLFAADAPDSPTARLIHRELQNVLLRALVLLAALEDAEGPCLPIGGRTLRLLGHLDVLAAGMLTQPRGPVGRPQ